jgi:predicted molibdopterin-dependent oxidoreductase YjgC
MCDAGRASYKDVSGLERLLSSSIEGRHVAPDAAVAALVARIKSVGAAKVGFVLGNRATNEANWALLQLARGAVKGAQVFFVAGNDHGEGRSDEILQSSDRNPNTAGAKLLAAHDGRVGDADALRGALPELELLVVLEDDVVARLDGVGTVSIAFLGAVRNRTSKQAVLVLPTSHAVEQDGSFTNRQDRVQRIRRAVDPAGDSAPAYVVLDRVASALGASIGTSLVAGSFNAMARAVTRMKGMEFKGLGEGGLLLASVAPAETTQGAEA